MAVTRILFLLFDEESSLGKGKDLRKKKIKILKYLIFILKYELGSFATRIALQSKSNLENYRIIKS